MVLILSLREKDFYIQSKPRDISNIKPKDINEEIVSLYLRLCWLDISISKSIKEVYLINDTNLSIVGENVRKIEIGKIIFNLKKINSHYKRLNPNVIQYITEMLRNTTVLNRNDYAPEKIKLNLATKEVCFISNRSGELTFQLIEDIPSTSLHPLQYSGQNFLFAEIVEVNEYLQMLGKIMGTRKEAIKVGSFIERAVSLIELFGRDTIKELNSIGTNEKIFLQGGDNLLVEEIIRYLIKGHIFNFLWDFRVGIPEFEREYDSLIFFNIDYLSTSGDQSRFWLRVRDFSYAEKLTIVTAKNENFKFNSPFEFKTIQLPTLAKTRKDALRILIFLINKKTSKSMIWEVPNAHYESPLNSFLSDIKDASFMDNILENMDLRLYADKIYSVDFWYDFLQLKQKLMASSDDKRHTHNISSYLVPLSDIENKKLATYGDVYKITRDIDNGVYTIQVPSGRVFELTKSKGMDYLYYLRKNNYTYPECIDAEKLYEEVAGQKYIFAKKIMDLTPLFSAIRGAVKHLFTEQAPYLSALNDCFEFGVGGCFYVEKGKIRVKTATVQAAKAAPAKS